MPKVPTPLNGMVAPKMLVRPATSEDSAAVQEIFARHLDAMQTARDPELDADMGDFPAGYQGAAGHFIVALNPEGQIIGMGGILDGIVRRLHVVQQWRGHGVASRIVKALIEWHQTHSDQPLAAIVARSNAPVRRLFLRCGFQPTQQTPSHPKMQHCEILSWPSGASDPKDDVDDL